MSPYTISKLYLLHICVLVSLFYVKIQLMHYTGCFRRNSKYFRWW